VGTRMWSREDQNHRFVIGSLDLAWYLSDSPLGYTYMAISNLNIFDATKSARQIALFAIGLLDRLKAFNEKRKMELELTIGINIGSCVGGVIGRTKVSLVSVFLSTDRYKLSSSHSTCGEIP
jgi:hypothetical protein